MSFKTAESRAEYLVVLPERKLSLLARQFCTHYTAAYQLPWDPEFVRYQALLDYAHVIEKLPRETPSRSYLPKELADIVKQRKKIMEKFLRKHANHPCVWAKISAWNKYRRRARV